MTAEVEAEAPLMLNLNLSAPVHEEKKRKRDVEQPDVGGGEDGGGGGEWGGGGDWGGGDLPPRKKKAFGDVNKNQQPEEFISALFSHNPDIPRLDLTQVDPLHEKLFTARSFADVGIHPYLVQNLEQNLNITEMTQVQMQSIPYILAGKDALIKSQTGSGKTLAYALPVLQVSEFAMA